jgi:hypothetical protein
LLIEGNSHQTVGEHLKSLMAVEFVRVQDGEKEVVIGLDWILPPPRQIRHLALESVAVPRPLGPPLT